MSQWFKRGSNWRTNSPVYPFSQLIKQFQVATRRTSPDKTLVFHASVYGRFIEIQSNFRRKNQNSNFLRGSFSNIDNVRTPIQFGREIQPQHLKWLFFLRDRHVHIYIISTSVNRPVKRNQLSSSSIEINKPLPAPVQCLVDQIQVQNPILVAAIDQMPDHI